MGASEKLERAKKKKQVGIGDGGAGAGELLPPPPPPLPRFVSSLAPIFRLPPLFESLEQARFPASVANGSRELRGFPVTRGLRRLHALKQSFPSQGPERRAKNKT